MWLQFKFEFRKKCIAKFKKEKDLQHMSQKKGSFP